MPEHMGGGQVFGLIVIRVYDLTNSFRLCAVMAEAGKIS